MGADLNNLEKLSDLAAEMTVPRAIKERHAALTESVKGLRDLGSTALGPALYLSVKLAGRVAGSRVVICTDGAANEGLGKLQSYGNALTGMDGPDFYPFVGNLAKELGVIVNMISFQGFNLF